MANSSTPTTPINPKGPATPRTGSPAKGNPGANVKVKPVGPGVKRG